MPVFLLNEEFVFPDTSLAESDGLLAIGGDLSYQRLLMAYKNGIFPWYCDDEPIMWWTPASRFILKPSEVKIAKSMRPYLNGKAYNFKINTDFRGVLSKCKTVPRNDQEGTWITTDMQHAYNKLFEMGWAHSFETWKEDVLVGGLYGIAIGTTFFGESMFSTSTNASKYAFIKCCQFLERKGFKVIDCQIHSNHLESLGAYFIERKVFEDLIGDNSERLKCT